MNRDNESVGGGYFVFKRNPETGRIDCPVHPFEYPNSNSAAARARVLARMFPGQQFDVVRAVGSTKAAETVSKEKSA